MMKTMITGKDIFKANSSLAPETIQGAIIQRTKEIKHFQIKATLFTIIMTEQNYLTFAACY